MSAEIYSGSEGRNYQVLYISTCKRKFQQRKFLLHSFRVSHNGFLDEAIDNKIYTCQVATIYKNYLCTLLSAVMCRCYLAARVTFYSNQKASDC